MRRKLNKETIGKKDNEAKFGKTFTVDSKEKLGGKTIDTTWTGQELQTPTSETKLSDDKGLGREIILRRFDFIMPPMPKSHIPSKKDIIEQMKPQILTMLWSDNLEPTGDLRVEFFHTKDGKQGYSIFITGQAKAGHKVYQQAQKLTNIVNARS